ICPVPTLESNPPTIQHVDGSIALANATKTVGRDGCLQARAAEGSRTPRRFAYFVNRAKRRQVFECGCPLPLSSPSRRRRHFESHPPLPPIWRIRFNSFNPFNLLNSFASRLCYLVWLVGSFY